MAAIPPIPLQALVAALKLITSSVWFFSHALMAARKRDDVQSYTDASHFTEEMSCQLYQSLQGKRISYHVLLLLLLPPPPPPLPPPLLISLLLLLCSCWSC